MLNQLNCFFDSFIFFTISVVMNSDLVKKMAKISIDLDALDDGEIINEDSLITEEDLKKPTGSDLGKLYFLLV